MARARVPLTIVVIPPVSEWEEIDKLVASGHTVTKLDIDADLILGPNCWLMTEKHRQYFDLAIKRANKLMRDKK